MAIDNKLGDHESLQARLLFLEALDEKCRKAYLHIYAMQKRKKSFYDSKLIPKTFKVGVFKLTL